MKTLIIGGGLSGLALARALEAQGADYLLIEARQRYGGRIETAHFDGGYFDLGPAWFWAGQPRIAALIDALGLERFAQHTEGAFVFEDTDGQVQRNRGFADMQGSWRLKGGLAALTQSLADAVPNPRKRLDAAVTTLVKNSGGITAILANGTSVRAEHAVLALPPRVAAQITYSPTLPEKTVQAMEAVPTWMAGQAKAVAVYDTPFWREAGLSGDASSRHGPMVEVHDASPHDGGPYALFGFIGVPPERRRDPHQMDLHLRAQLVRLFGPQAANPTQLFVKDWALDTFTATPADHAPLYAHPTYALPDAMTDLWDGTLHFAGTEVAPQFGGYLEGALEAAENVLSRITRQQSA